MKIFAFLIAIIINFHDNFAENNDSLLTQVAVLKVMSYELIREKCYANSTESFQRFKEIANNATRCTETVLNESPIFETSLKTFKDNIQSCADDLIEEHERCYPEELKEWPQLNFDMLLSFIDYVYENKEELASPKVTTYLQNCTKEFRNVSQDYAEFLPCFKNIHQNFTEIKGGCQSVIELERCLMKQLVEKCPTDEDLVKKLTVDMLASLAEPCAEYDATENPMDNMFTLLAPYAPPNINPDLM